MKKIMSLMLITLGVVSFSNAQSITYDEVQQLEGRMYKKVSGYTTKDGTTYNIGDKIKIGAPVNGKFFAFIHTGDGVLVPKESMSIKMSYKEVEIKSMRIWGTRKKQSPQVVFGIADPTTSMLPRGSIIVESAIESGEIDTGSISSDEALIMLKKSKDKLDLGLITQEDFDKEKEELSKYIN